MRRFLRGLSAVTLVNVLNGVLGVVIVPIAVRRLGIEGYGLYSIFPVLAGYLVLAELGLGKNLIRVLGGAGTESEVRDLLRLAFGLYAGIAAVLILLAPLLVLAVEGVLFPVNDVHVAAVRWITAIAVLDYLLGIPVSLRWNHALSRERMTDYARFMLISHSSRYALMLAGVLLTRRVEVAVAFVLGRRFVDLCAAPMLLPALPEGSWRPRLERGKSLPLLRQSTLLALTQLLQLSTVAAGSVLINGFFGLAALGIYRSAFDIVSKVWFFSSTAGTVVFPRFIQMMRRKDARERLGRVLPGVQGASWMMYTLAAVAGVLVSPLAPSVLRLAGTPPFLFALLLTGVLWNAHAVISSEVLQAGGRFREVGETAAISFVTMVAVFLLLSRREPTLAIGWAWLASQFIASACVDAYALRPFGASSSVARVFGVRAPGAALALVALGWIADVHVALLSAAALVALFLSLRELPIIKGALLDLRSRAPLAEGIPT